MAGPSIDHVVFDWNGTLLYDLPLAVQGVNHVLSRHGLSAIDVDSYRSHFHFPIQSFYAGLGFDFGKVPFSHLVKDYLSIFDASVIQCPLYGDVRGCLDSLKASGLGASILSASHVNILRQCIQKHDLSDYFIFQMGLTNEEAASKLDQGRVLAKRLGQNKRVLYIGDTTHDAEVAAALGWPCILVARGHQHRHRLAESGCPVVGDLGEVLTRIGLAMRPPALAEPVKKAAAG